MSIARVKLCRKASHPKLLQRLSQASLQDTPRLLLLVQALLHLLPADSGTLSQLCLQTLDLHK